LCSLDYILNFWVNCHPALTREQLASEYDTFEEDLNYLSRKWTSEFDQKLRPAVKQFDGFSVPPATLEQVEALFSGTGITPRLFSVRLGLISVYVRHLSTLEAFGENYIPRLFRQCPRLLFGDELWKKIQDLVFVRMSNTRVSLHFHRLRAWHFQNSDFGNFRDSLLGQLIEQLPRGNLWKLKRSDSPWHVSFSGEGAVDAGGPGRAVFTDICREIMLPKMSLFVPTPNCRNGEGKNQDLLIPNPEINCNRENAFYYAGVLMALAYVTSSTQPFTFVDCVWNFLMGADVTFEDIISIDANFNRIVNADLSKLPEGELMNLFPSRLEMQNSLGSMVDLVPRGRNISILPQMYREYAEACKKFRIAEFTPALKAISAGFWLIFPKEAAQALSGPEIAALICGSDQCPVDELREHGVVTSDPSGQEPMLWRVLQSFTSAERIDFIAFATGRGGLPPPGLQWGSMISIVSSSNNDNTHRIDSLATAMTCYSTITIPFYSSEEKMASLLRKAFEYGKLISDGANALDAAEVEPLRRRNSSPGIVFVDAIAVQHE
jgi:hypothetical protein